MTLNSSNAIIIDRRRTHVARLRLAGLTLREIEDSLPKLGVYNPKTGKPFSLRTVYQDVEAMREEWRKDAAESMAELSAGQLARVREVYRKAMLNKDYRTALAAIKHEMELLGTAAPKRHEITGAEGGPLQVEYVNDWRNIPID